MGAAEGSFGGTVIKMVDLNSSTDKSENLVIPNLALGEMACCSSTRAKEALKLLNLIGRTSAV